MSPPDWLNRSVARLSGKKSAENDEKKHQNWLQTNR